MMRNILLAVLLLFAVMPAMGRADDQALPRAYFANLKDGDKVTSPVKIMFGVSGLTVAPAGTEAPGTGHFHLLVDTTLSAEEQQYAIPSDAQHIHFGKGQTETTLTLPPGPHTLQLVMGMGNHQLHKNPVMSDVIHITVQ